jgi:hypothetical protein
MAYKKRPDDSADLDFIRNHRERTGDKNTDFRMKPLEEQGTKWSAAAKKSRLVPIKNNTGAKSNTANKTRKASASTTVRLVDKAPKSKLKSIKSTPAKKKALVREY